MRRAAARPTPTSRSIRARVQKMADIGPAFAATARRREQKARDAEAAESLVTARDNYFMAAIHWGAAQWPYDENDETNVAYNQKKRECYQHYARLADHHVEAVWLPFGNSALPAWFHLPPNYRGGKLPAVIVIPGMDSFKEMSVALYGDRWLNRGIAVLAIDGPGQYEAPMVGINVSMENWTAAGPVLLRLARGAPEVDPERIAVNGTSFGSFFAHDRRRQRAAPARLRGHGDVPRTRRAHDLRRSVADVQEALHVHVGLHRRSRLRRNSVKR